MATRRREQRSNNAEEDRHDEILPVLPRIRVTLGAGGGDCLAQTTHGADTLTNPEPGFFILGAKSYGRNNTFLMRIGWEQVGEVFGLLR
jgi:hypothetical protein